MGKRCLRADGLRVPELLDGILPLFVLDAYVDDPVVMMAPVPGDSADPAVEAVYISTPHALHVDHVKITAAAGKHVLVEKPLALTLADASVRIVPNP